MRTELRKKSISGVKWTTLSSAVAAVVQLAQLIILTRFLSPAEYGVWGIISVLIGFSYVFVDMGISNAIIYFQDVTREELSSLYWLNIMAGALVFLTLCALAPFFAWFYQTTALVTLVPIIGLTFLIIPFGQQYKVLFQKELQFRTISFIEVSTKIAGFVIMLILLIAGFRLNAVAWSTVITAAMASGMFFILGGKAKHPQLLFHMGKVKKFLKFGMFQMLSGITNYFNLQIDSLIIGRLLGLEALGHYTLAKNLVLRPMFLINPIITRVTFPVMAKVQQDLEVLRRTYLKTVAYLSLVNFPMYIFLTFFAAAIVHLVFGAKWEDSILLLQVLSIWAAFRSAGNPIGSLLMARGRADWEFYWNFALLVIVPIVIWISSFWSIEGVCYGQLFLRWTLTIPAWYLLAYPLCKVGLLEFYVPILRPFLFSLFAGCVALGLVTILPPIGGIGYLSFVLFVFGMVYWILLKRYEKGFLIILKDMLFSKKIGDKTSLINS